MDRPVGLTGSELTWLISFLGLKTRTAVGQGQTMAPVTPRVDGVTPTVQRPVQHQPRAPSHRCLSPAARAACRVELVPFDYPRKCREFSYTRVSPESNT